MLTEEFTSLISGPVPLQAGSRKSGHPSKEIGDVDRWIDSHESLIHRSLMQLACDEKSLIMKLNAELDAAPSRSPATPSAAPDGPGSIHR